MTTHPAHESRFPESKRLSLHDANAFWRRLQKLRQAFDALSGTAESRQSRACAVTATSLAAYWDEVQRPYRRAWVMSQSPWGKTPRVAAHLLTTADDLGRLAARYEPLLAGYMLGELYTALLPAERRSTYGIFYTPPALTRRLLALASAAGVDWSTATVLDPACGGGAFLTPVALMIRTALVGEDPRATFAHLAKHVAGFEIDSFGAWMSHVLLEAALIDLCREIGKRFPPVVTVCDALLQQPEGNEVDVVIGNPPYGRMSLTPELRTRYGRSLYGHANAYGVFLDLAARWARPSGTIAFVTPTGFLGGQYFRELRAVLAHDAPPVAIDVVRSRKGVFSDVLQETLLGIYRRDGAAAPAAISIVSLQSPTDAEASPTGELILPVDPRDPWLLPRDAEQSHLIRHLRSMPHRLADYGYAVSTGPLVWNRHKEQLHVSPVEGSVPIIWAESITADGTFRYSVDKRNHKPWLKPNQKQGWLITSDSCVLVQRTTAKEQRRRLIAAELPVDFLAKHGAVSVENHLNMIKPLTSRPRVTARAVAALLNSGIVDAAFRCISGSVAVSASELEALPLPPPDALVKLERLVAENALRETIDRYVSILYTGGESRDAVA
ncbi:MAG TPA: N-6 DNA methylase [Thermoanaerobaculia bacterium]